jgi:hypothetical protein
MSTNAATLAEVVTRRVIDRTGRRVRNLRVEVGNGWLRLHGDAPSYHVKQLAQHAAGEAVPTARLENAIVVA